MTRAMTRRNDRKGEGIPMHGIDESEDAEKDALEVEQSFMRTYSNLRRKPTIVRYKRTTSKPGIMIYDRLYLKLRSDNTL